MLMSLFIVVLLVVLILFSILFYFIFMADESSTGLAHGRVIMGRPGLDLGSSSAHPVPASV